MKIKKKDLRKREAQLPINYPDPEVLPESLPGGAIDFNAEMVQVEILCKRLAHNEVVVRDTVLEEVPRYLQRLTASVAAMEQSYAEEIAAVQDYFKAHPKAPNPYHYENMPLALQEFRDAAQERHREGQRRQAVRELRHQRAEEKRQREQYGCYGNSATTAASTKTTTGAEEDEEEEGNGAMGERTYSGSNVHRERYQAWMEAWCDVELVFLKLCRGIHFCLWHSDKPLVQLACAQRIANLIRAPQSTRCKILFYGSLFRVLAREWSTIDRYRMDKYLALVRKMVFEFVRLGKEVYDKEEQTSAAHRPSTAGSEVSSKSLAKSKKSAVSGKRGRQSGSAAEATVPEASSENATPSSMSLLMKSAHSIPEGLLQQSFGSCAATLQTLRELFYIFHKQIFPHSSSIGLTMHLCDVAFDELVRAELPPNLFVVVSSGLPLYAMSQGNYVEKRVLDSFFPPIAGGVLVQRRTEQLLRAITAAQSNSKLHQTKEQKKNKSTTITATSSSAEELQAMAESMATKEASDVMLDLAACCRSYAIARGTAHEVRAMFSEAELIMRQSADPASYETLTHTAQRRRIERELDEVETTRRKVREERQAVRDLKKQGRRDVLKEKIKSRKAVLAAAGAANGDASLSTKAIREKILSEERVAAQKGRPATRNTKRKKNYRLTKKDLYGDADEDDSD